MRGWTIAQAGYLSYLQYWYSAEALSPLSSASQPRQGRSWDETIQNLFLFLGVGKGQTGPWWWPSCVLAGTPQFQPHSLSTYSWVICSLQMSSSNTSIASLLCVSPQNWEWTDGTKPPMSVMNQNWVCGSMGRTKPKIKKKSSWGRK